MRDRDDDDRGLANGETGPFSAPLVEFSATPHWQFHSTLARWRHERDPPEAMDVEIDL